MRQFHEASILSDPKFINPPQYMNKILTKNHIELKVLVTFHKEARYPDDFDSFQFII